jgi:hypothetical protein
MAWEWSASPTCLPNGPANTRCSGFRPSSSPFEPSLYRLRSPLPGNGFRTPETEGPKPPPGGLHWRQRPHVRYLNRGNARKLRAIRQRPGNAGSNRTAWWWMESRSNRSQHPNSLIYGNLQGIFCSLQGIPPFDASETCAGSGDYGEIPYSAKQGIFLAGSGKLAAGTGIIPLRNHAISPPASCGACSRRPLRKASSGYKSDPEFRSSIFDGGITYLARSCRRRQCAAIAVISRALVAKMFLAPGPTD